MGAWNDPLLLYPGEVMHVPAPLPVLLASDTAGYVLFGLFVVALVVLVVITLAWVIRRDRALRAEWRQRQMDAGGTPYGIIPKGDQSQPAPPASNPPE
jgi:hypothetical protein